MQLHQPPLPVNSFHDSIHFQSSGVRCMDPSLSDHEQSTASFQGRRRYRNLLCKTSRLGLDGCLQRKPMLIYFQDVSVWSYRNRLKEVLATLKERLCNGCTMPRESRLALTSPPETYALDWLDERISGR